MRSNLKWRSFLLLGLVLLLVSSVVGCANEPSKPPVSYPVLTAEQVISRVQVYGVPTIKIDGKPPSPVGQWAATYEGDGKWRVQGAVVWKDDYHSTTWIHTHEKIELILWDGRSPSEKAPSSTYSNIDRAMGKIN